MTATIGFFYGSTTGMTEDIAFQMAQIAKETHNIELAPVNVIDLPDPTAMFACKALIIAMPTWNYGEYQDDWELVMDKISSIDLSAHTIALVGLGDQIGYPDYYLDALGMFAAQMHAQGATLIGEWKAEGYEFSASKALQDNGCFVGLALDEDSQPEYSQERMQGWLEIVLPILQEKAGD